MHARRLGTRASTCAWSNRGERCFCHLVLASCRRCRNRRREEQRGVELRATGAPLWSRQMDESGSHMITPTPLETWCCEARARLRPGVPRLRWPPRVASRLAPPLLVAPLLDRCHECDMLHQGITNKSSCMGDCRHHRQHCATGQLHRLKGSAHQGAKTPEGPHAVTSRIMPPWLC